MIECTDRYLGAEVLQFTTARARRDMGIAAVERAARPEFPLFLDVKLGDTDDAPTVRAHIVVDSPTAYRDALTYGMKNQATVLWGRVRQGHGDEPTSVYKMAVIFDHDALPSYQDMNKATQAVADLAGPNHRFDIAENYHQDVWRSVTLPPQEEYALAA